MADELADQLQDTSGIQGDTSPPVSEPIERETAPEPKKSLRDQIKDNWEAAKAEKPDAPKVDGRPRDDTGKFLPKTDAAPAKEAAPKEPPATEKEAQPVKQASTPVGPPPGWSKESKAIFETLPPSVKADVLKREQEVSKGFKDYSDKTKRYDEIEQVLSPRRATYQQLGVQSDAQAINTLMQWEEFVRTNPVQAIRQLAQSRNIDLSQLVPRQSTEPTSDAGFDVTSALRPVLDQYIQPIAQELNTLKAERQREVSQRVESDIQQFSKDKPHFERVRVLMGKMIASGAAPNLDTAYQMATRADPEVYAEIQAEEEAKRQAELRTNKVAQAQNARKAAVSITSSSPTGSVVNGSGKQPKNGIRGSILSAIEEARERQRA